MPIQYYSHFRLLSVCQVHSMGLSIPVGKYYSHKWGAFGEREKKWKAQLDINRQTNCLINYAIELSNIFPKWNYYWSSILFWAPAITVSLYLQFRPTIHHAISVYPSVVPHPSAQLQTTAFQQRWTSSASIFSTERSPRESIVWLFRAVLHNKSHCKIFTLYGELLQDLNPWYDHRQRGCRSTNKRELRYAE